MKFIEVDNSDRGTWLKWRHSGIGSSDAASIMGVSRFKTREQLLIEKSTEFTGEDQSNAYIKDRGNKIETQVRKYLEEKHNKTFSPLSCMMTNFNFFKCSIDGITEDRKVITEIKLLTTYNPEKPNTESPGYIKWSKAISGEVPVEYYPQIQHLLMVTGAEKCIFLGYREVKGDYKVTSDKLATIEVLPDKGYIHKLAVEEFKFWLRVEETRDKLIYRSELE